MFTPSPPPEVKQRLRSEKLFLRKSQHTTQKKDKDQKIIKKISSLAAFKKAKNVLFYLPVHGEVDLTGLFGKFSKKKTFFLPRVKGKTLELHLIKNLTHTSKGKFNVTEPKKHLPTVKPSGLDLVLVPGVVFGLDGHRIGYGKGFYDRLLKKTICPKIGIAYGFQIVKNISGDPHDVPMDMIITEQKTLKVRRKGLKP